MAKHDSDTIDEVKPAEAPVEPINTGYDIPPPQWVRGTVVPKDTAVKDMTESEYAQYMYENLTPFWAIRANLIYQHDPVISSLEPSTAAIGDPSFKLVVTGETFTNESVIVFAGHDENTQLNEDGTLSTGVNMAYWHGPDVIPVMVRNGSMYSEPAEFTFTAAAPEAAEVDTWPKKKAKK